MTGIKIELTKLECDLAERLALDRIVSADRSYADPLIHNAGNNYIKNHRLGAYGEIAVCKHFNIYPEISGGQDNTDIDCTLNGKRIDVKAADFHQARLLVEKNAGDKGTVDIYILAIVEPPIVWIKGRTSAKRIVRPELITEPRKGKPCYTMEQSSPDFLTYVNKSC